MFPTLPGFLPAHAMFLVLGCAVGAVTALWCTRADGIRLERVGGLTVVVLGALAVALLGAKLDSLLERGRAEPLLWELRQGYRQPGGFLAVIVALPVLARWYGKGLSVARLGDALAPAAGVAMAVVRVGCFLAGCCHGTVSDVPWAVTFPRDSYAWVAQTSAGLIPADAPAALPAHPLQLYLGAWSLALGLFLLWYHPRKAYDGQVILLWLALDNGGKFFFEFLRDPPVAHLRWLALGIAAAAAGALALKRSR